MTRTNIDIDDDACGAVMRRYGLSTKREAVNFALRMLQSGGVRGGNRFLQETQAAYRAGPETQPAGNQWFNPPRQLEQQEDVTYRRATIEETRRMRGETDFDAVPSREEWLFRPLVPVKRPTVAEVRALRGIGWEGNLDEMRRNSPHLEEWLNAAEGRPLPSPDSDTTEPGTAP